MNLKDTQLGDRIVAMIKGDNGSGKSILASSFPKPHFFFFEQRWRSLYSYWLKVNPDKINEISYDYLGGSSRYAIMNAIKAKVERPENKTLVIDAVTSAGDNILSQIKIGKGNDGKVISGIRVNDGEDFSAEDAFFKELREETIDKFPGHVIWIAHIITTEQQNMMKGTTTISRQIVSGAKKIAAKLPGYFDEVWHTQVEGSKYTFLTRHAGTDYAKTSLPIKEVFDFTEGNAYDLLTKDLSLNFDKLVKEREKQAELKARTVTI